MATSNACWQTTRACGTFDGSLNSAHNRWQLTLQQAWATAARLLLYFQLLLSAHLPESSLSRYFPSPEHVVMNKQYWLRGERPARIARVWPPGWMTALNNPWRATKTYRDVTGAWPIIPPSKNTTFTTNARQKACAFWLKKNPSKIKTLDWIPLFLSCWQVSPNPKKRIRICMTSWNTSFHKGEWNQSREQIVYQTESSGLTNNPELLKEPKATQELRSQWTYGWRKGWTTLNQRS